MDVSEFLMSNKIATIGQLKNILKTTGTMTVFRKLRVLGYLSSYSHRGKYCTLHGIPKFDQSGLWSFDSVWFSRYGNLIETAREFIDNSATGLTADELGETLYVEVRHTLLKLFQTNRIYREKVSGVYVYAASESAKRKPQIAMRKNSPMPDIDLSYEIEELSAELRASVILFLSLPDERQRRAYAGLESFRLGYGGDKKIALLLGLDTHTVSKGRKELFGGNVEKERVRKEGAGRKPVEKKLRKSSEK